MELQLLLLALVTASVSAAPQAGKYQGEPSRLTRLDDAAAAKGAVCLDGSPPGYYFRPGSGSGANKWLLHLMGGGWCFLGVEDCYNRSSTIYGSSKNWTSTYTFHGALSSEQVVNPAFYNWNTVFFIYCDGASFSADREAPDEYDGKKLYYRGFRILTAIMEDLNTNRNLKEASDVVLTGCSAGGLAVYMHMNYIQTLVPPTARYRGLPDAGFFIDIPRYPRDQTVSSVFQNMIKSMGINNGLMEECRNDNPGDVMWKCIFAPHIYKYIKAPMFVLNSRYDTAQINDLFGLPCLPPHCNSEQMDYFHFFAKSFEEQVSEVLNNNSTGSGYFMDSCLVHCQTMEDHPWNVFKVGGKSASQAVHDWYFNVSPIQDSDCDYPCNPTCPGKWPPSVWLQKL